MLWVARETQDFASLPAVASVVMRGGRDVVICHTVYNNKFMVFLHEFISTIKSPYIEHFIPNAGIRNGTFGGYYLFF